MKAYAESFEIYHKRSSGETERESSGVEDSGELYLKFIEKFSIYRENKR